MHELLNFRAQRWILEDQGQRLILENAWTWGGQMQERVRLNGREIYASLAPNVPLRWTEVVSCDWPDAASRLTVEWKSGLFSIKARARASGIILPWTDYHIAQWRGAHGVWPD